ncbi:MAG: alanine dehydrogenase [Sulfuricellaceae bacterium]
MLIGVPKEIKIHEYRVGVTPAGVRALTQAGCEVLVETHAGQRIGFSDAMYEAAGAQIAHSAAQVYACPLIVKVKEPQMAELSLLHEGQVLFTYFHLAAAPELTARLLERRIVAIAYETVTDAEGALPLLTPMSEVAGRISIQAGATALQLANGGSGVLLGGVPGVAPARVVVLGAGTVGTQAARMALGAGADVTILDVNANRLRYLDDLFGPHLKTRFSEAQAIDELVRDADLLVGSILIPGKSAPKLVTREAVRAMRPGSVLVDVAIDQGGCAETSRPTTHAAPTYVEEGVVHYCVTNMPAACARTSTQALTNATLPYALLLARQGWQSALRDHAGLRNGLNLCGGAVTYERVAEDLGYPYLPAEQALV